MTNAVISLDSGAKGFPPVLFGEVQDWFYTQPFLIYPTSRPPKAWDRNHILLPEISQGTDTLLQFWDQQSQAALLPLGLYYP